MEIQALINIDLNIEGDTNVENILANIRNMKPEVQWVSIVFGPNADAVAYVIADGQNTIAKLAVRINLLEGVAGTSTQILATV